jgi:hypothetical protein
MNTPNRSYNNFSKNKEIMSWSHKIKNKSVILPAMLMILATTVAHAETITKTTIVEQQTVEGVRKIDFMSFDLNHDSKLSMNEVGDVLFNAFDSDSNGAIDNIEYDKASVSTVIPMEVTTLTFIDYNDDGMSDVSRVNKDEFLERSNLMRFDKDKDGLSPRDFMGSEVKAMDMNHNNLIEKDEWQRQYALKVKPKAAIGKRYNR